MRYDSAVAWIDVSVPLRTGMVTFEGDPAVRIEPATRIAAGDLANVSRMELGTHTGTHMDAPRHFIDGAPGIDRLPLDALVGPALVADARGAPGDIDAAALAALGVPAGTERLLLRTRNETLWERDAFTRDFVGIAADAARELVATGVRLVGHRLPLDRAERRPRAGPPRAARGRGGGGRGPRPAPGPSGGLRAGLPAAARRGRRRRARPGAPAARLGLGWFQNEPWSFRRQIRQQPSTKNASCMHVKDPLKALAVG